MTEGAPGPASAQTQAGQIAPLDVVGSGSFLRSLPECAGSFGCSSGCALVKIAVGRRVVLHPTSPDVLVLQEKAVTQAANFNFVLANGQIHDWIILTVDGPRYWSQINQQLGI